MACEKSLVSGLHEGLTFLSQPKIIQKIDVCVAEIDCVAKVNVTRKGSISKFG